jgi:hypothetical protein
MSTDTHRTFEKGNTNPMRYIVKGYCKKYPNDPGDQDIHEEDVARPSNHKWAEKGNHNWKVVSTVRIPTYGTCGICWNSGPAYKMCKECSLGEYQVVVYNNYILDSQKIAELLGKQHETAKANRLQHWIRTRPLNWSYDLMQPMLLNKHKNIEDKREKKRAVREDYQTFTAFYKEIGMD